MWEARLSVVGQVTIPADGFAMTSLGPFPLWTLIWTAAAIAVFFIECVLYFALVGSYYRFGPAVSRQIWRTGVTPNAAADAVESALAASSLAWRRKSQGAEIFFSVRKGAMRISMWPRIALRIEQDPATDAAVITCETRPFLSLLLLLPAWIFVRGASVLAGGFFIFLIAAGYIGFWIWERNAGELNDVRDRLAGIGVRVCPKCGYDLRASTERCPECGNSMESS